MASTALTGDRRWASGRRGGMTVLGKVTVPKPINLPSQRLENHGLDPNVEIVPKGTLSWGSKTSTTSNAWGSSTLSPKADGGTLSPSNLSARPFSCENGTRPSTADSDRAHDPSTTDWGTNSRPSSVSGAHSSSQTSSVLLRPRSAETRPGSSQLSRFAEPSTENSVVGVVERMGMPFSRNDGFSLSSGDFPVLGSDRNDSGKSTISQEHPSQGSGSPSVAITMGRGGDSSLENEVKSGVLNSWKREDNVLGEDGVRPGIDKWHGESPPFSNAVMRPQHFNAWRSPMVNNHPPGSSWYRGPPGGPHGGPVTPGGFPMEPFPFYHPQAAPPVLPNPQPAPPSGTGPRGYHPNNGDFYRSPIPDAFFRPNMPMRPGFYPGPLPYGGYFGPQLRYRSPNEQDIAFVGIPPGVPSPYCLYPAPENGNSNARYAGFGDKILGSEKAELDCDLESSAQNKVLLKQHDSCDEGGENHRWGESKAIGESSLNNEAHCKRVSSENDRKLECMKGVDKNSEIGHPKAYPKSDERIGASVPCRMNSPEYLLVHPNDVNPARRSKHKHAAAEVSQSLFASAKDSSLIQKIESLNAKARASENQLGTSPVSDRPEQSVNVQMPLLSHSTTEIKSGAQFVQKNQDTRNSRPEWSGQVISTGGKSCEQSAVGGAIFSRPHAHWGQGRGHHHGGRFGTPDTVEWHNPLDSAMPSVETSNAFQNPDAVNPLVSRPLKNDGETKSVAVDLGDSLAERARMKELAKQRVRQRQEEEEERARDQKARALMKLEELNKRKQLEESLNSKTSVSSSGTATKSEQQQGSLPPPGRNNASTTSVVSARESCSEYSLVSHSDVHLSGVDDYAISSGEAVSRSSQTSHLQRNAKSESVADHIPGNRSYKHNRVVSKENPNMLSEKTFIGEAHKVDSQTAVVAKSSESVLDEITPSAEEIPPSNRHNVVETILHQRRKGSKNSRTKHKVDDPLPASVSIAAVEATSRISTPEENRASKSLKSDMDSSLVHPLQDSEDLKQSFERPLAVSTETARARVNFHGGSQHPRRTSRNQQVSKQSEKSHGSDAVMWAPRSQNRTEVAVETNDETPIESANLSLKNDVGQKNPKHKRAEMERYVPKPVAKEMAQQGNISQMATRSNKSTLIEGTAASSQSIIENDQSLKPIQGKETGTLDSRLNKSGGAVGLWRQRGPKEFMTEGESLPTESSKDDDNIIEDLLPKVSELSNLKENQKFEGRASGEGTDRSLDSDSTGHVFQATRDPRPAARVKHRNYRATGTNMDIKPKKGSELSGKTCSQSSVSDQNQKVPASGVVDRSTSHWQPKPPKFFTDIPQGSRTGVKSGEIVGTTVDVEESPKTEAVPISRSKDKLPSDASTINNNAELGTRTDHANEGPHLEVNKREGSMPQNRGPSRQHESGLSAGRELQRSEPEMRPGSVKNQNSRYAKGYDSHADWSQRGRHGKERQNPSLNRERQQLNSHYRYQPVGMGDNNRMDYVEGSGD